MSPLDTKRVHLQVFSGDSVKCRSTDMREGIAACTYSWILGTACIFLADLPDLGHPDLFLFWLVT